MGRFCGKPFCLKLKISPFKFKSSLVSVKEEDFLQSEYFANLAKSQTFNLIKIFLLCVFQSSQSLVAVHGYPLLLAGPMHKSGGSKD